MPRRAGADRARVFARCAYRLRGVPPLPARDTSAARLHTPLAWRVHLHSTRSVAVSCLADVDTADVLPPLTGYYVMRIGTLPPAPYFPPGDEGLGDAVAQLAGRNNAELLVNHGPVVAASDLAAAANAIEELESAHQLGERFGLVNDWPQSGSWYPLNY